MLQRHCAPLAGSSQPSVQRHVEEDPENSAVQLSTPAQLCLRLRKPSIDKSILNRFIQILMLQPFVAKLQTYLYIQSYSDALFIQTAARMSQSDDGSIGFSQSTQYITYGNLKKKTSAENLCELPDNLSRYRQHHCYNWTHNKAAGRKKKVFVLATHGPSVMSNIAAFCRDDL